MTKAIVAIILVLGICSSQDQEPQRVTVRLEEVGGGATVLEVPFTISEGGVLVIGLDPYFVDVGGVKIPMIGVPIEIWQALYLVLPRETVRIDSLGQLRGRVHICSAQEALAFCRLLTSPRTWHLWSCSEVEILSADQLDSELVFGESVLWSADYLDYLRREANGYQGIVSSRQKLDEIGIRPAQVRAIPEGYQIRRSLMVRDYPEDRPRTRQADVVEVVGYDGSYVRTKSRVRDLPAGVRWVFDWFM